MVKQTIQIFARVKPTKSKTGSYELTDEDGRPVLSFFVPREAAEGYINNKKENYKFTFQKIFDQNTKQDEIFDNVAKPVVDNVLKGYNGTIFAYGQTGSGKTFTITGGAERYIDRGIIPRTLSYIFQCFEKNPDQEYTTHVSYLEIYNEAGYDLLDPKHEAAKLEDLPKVSLMEDADQNIHLRNLSTHPAANEEDALNLLFLGDTNRMIAETPMNQASTRSHCIFTIHITSRESGSATIRRAKLHLVDLAGSERIGKTGVNGQLLTEAKYINLSLHYLEHVIVALSEKSRAHIPYRNSMMTSILRDSLGGNCMTSMVATCSAEKKNIDESISTCRFAQRVALIKNDALLNEELDPNLMIARLKREVQSLKEELAMATGEQRTDDLSEEDLERCQESVERYLKSTDPDGYIDIGADMRKIHECFRIMKTKVLEKPQSGSSSSLASNREAAPPSPPTKMDESGASSAEMKKLKDILMQRDNEINILVGMLKKEKKRAADAISQLDKLGQPHPRSASRNGQIELVNGLSNNNTYTTSDTRVQHSSDNRGQHRSGSSNYMSVDSEREAEAGRDDIRKQEKERLKKEKEEKQQKKILGELSMGRQEAFEIFRRDYEHNQTISDNKDTLKQRYAEAKSLGESVNKTRAKINKLKNSIEQHRMSRVMQGLVDPENPEPDELEDEMKQQIENEKHRYKETFNRLRVLKNEIEHLQHLLEKSKVKLMKDFELWWAQEAAAAQEKQAKRASTPRGKKEPRNAWRTPPTSPHVSSTTLSAGPSQTSLLSNASSRNSSADSRSAPIPGHIRQSLAGGASDTSGYGSRESTSHQRSSSRSSHRSNAESGSIPLTGDVQADADIMAFLKARQNILHKANQQGHR